MFGDTLYPPQPRRGPSTCCRRCRRVARAGGAGEAAAQAAQKPLAGDVLERRRQAPAVLRWRRRQTRRHRQLFSAAGSAPLPAPALKTRFPCAGWTPFCKRRRRRRRASTRGGIPPPPPPQCLCQASTSVAPASPADPATAGAGTFNNNAGGGSQAQSRRRVVGRRRRRRQRGGEGRAPPPPRASARIYTRVRPPRPHIPPQSQYRVSPATAISFLSRPSRALLGGPAQLSPSAFSTPSLALGRHPFLLPCRAPLLAHDGSHQRLARDARASRDDFPARARGRSGEGAKKASGVASSFLAVTRVSGRPQPPPPSSRSPPPPRHLGAVRGRAYAHPPQHHPPPPAQSPGHY